MPYRELIERLATPVVEAEGLDLAAAAKAVGAPPPGATEQAALDLDPAVLKALFPKNPNGLKTILAKGAAEGAVSPAAAQIMASALMRVLQIVPPAILKQLVLKSQNQPLE